MQIMKNPTALVWGKKSAFQCASPRADVTVVMMVWYQSLLADYCHRLFALEILAGLQCSVFGFKRHADAVCRFLLRIQWFSRRRRYTTRGSHSVLPCQPAIVAILASALVSTPFIRIRALLFPFSAFDSLLLLCVHLVTTQLEPSARTNVFLMLLFWGNNTMSTQSFFFKFFNQHRRKHSL